MLFIPGHAYRMGSDTHYPEEKPARWVEVDGFWMDETPVTNRQFAEFVAATAYVTIAEKPPDPRMYPNLPRELMVPASAVFVPPAREVTLMEPMNWWRLIPGADWRHPSGPQSSIESLGDHPVIHVAYADAEAYALWADAALPTEAEWELAARAGLEGAAFAWGDELAPDGRILANYWRGQFPWQNLSPAGFVRTSPVSAFPPNAYGLRDMIGNVWEWTADWYAQPDPNVKRTRCCMPRNPRGGSESTSRDPAVSGIFISRKTTKGGSHLCAPNYCQRYRPAARFPQNIDTSTSHLGFRCVKRPTVKLPELVACPLPEG